MLLYSPRKDIHKEYPILLCAKKSFHLNAPNKSPDMDNFFSENDRKYRLLFPEKINKFFPLLSQHTKRVIRKHRTEKINEQIHVQSLQ